MKHKFYKILVNGKQYKIALGQKMYNAVCDNSSSIIFGTKNVVHLSLNNDEIVLTIKMLDVKRMPTYITLFDVSKSRSLEVNNEYSSGSYEGHGNRCTKFSKNEGRRFFPQQEVYKFKINKKQAVYRIPLSSLKDTCGFIHNCLQDDVYYKRRFYNISARCCKYCLYESTGKYGRQYATTKGKNLRFWKPVQQ